MLTPPERWAEELLDLDDVGASFEGVVAKVWRRAWKRVPGGDLGADAGADVEPLDEVLDMAG